MKINFMILTVLVLCVSVWTYFSDTKFNNAQLALTKVIDFDFKTIRGETSSLYAEEAKVTLLHFWATWCAPCVTELPQLIALANSYPDDMRIIAIAVNDKPKDIERFLKKHRLPSNFIVGLDENQYISEKLYGTVKLPETYIIDKNMALYEKIMGSEESWNEGTWRSKFKDLISNHNAPPSL